MANAGEYSTEEKKGQTCGGLFSPPNLMRATPPSPAISALPSRHRAHRRRAEKRPLAQRAVTKALARADRLPLQPLTLALQRFKRSSGQVVRAGARSGESSPQRAASTAGGQGIPRPRVEGAYAFRHGQNLSFAQGAKPALEARTAVPTAVFVADVQPVSSAGPSACRPLGHRSTGGPESLPHRAIAHAVRISAAPAAKAHCLPTRPRGAPAPTPRRGPGSAHRTAPPWPAAPPRGRPSARTR